MSKTDELDEMYDKYYELYEEKFGDGSFPGYAFQANPLTEATEDDDKRAIDAMKKCVEAGKDVYEMGFVDINRYLREEKTPLDHYFNCYEKKFGIGSFPTIPLLYRGEEWVIDSIKKCLKEGKDVYEMGYLEDPSSGVMY